MTDTNANAIPCINEYRFHLDFIRADYPRIEDAFERGDFMLAAEFAEDGSELQGMAMILAGLTQPGLDVLAAQDDLSDRACLIQAFGLWWSDAPASATQRLRKIPVDSPVRTAADRLAELINAPDIPIGRMTLPPPSKGSPPVEDPLQLPSGRVGQFTICDLAVQSASALGHGTVSDDLGGLIEKLPIQKRPRLLLSTVNHWISIQGSENVAIPRVLWNHDEDIFYYRNYDNFRNFDIHIVATSQQHFELSRGLDSFCVSNLVLDPYSTPYNHPTPGGGDKTIDILFTGATFDKFLSDKARFLYSISKLSQEHKLLFVQGRLPEREYHDTLGKTRFLPVVSRVLGNPSPRWREILENGGFLLYPQHTLFGKMVKGCFPFDPRNPVPGIKTHLDRARRPQDFPEYVCETVQNDVAQKFKPYMCGRNKQFERFLRYAIFTPILRDMLSWQAPSRPPGWDRPRKRRLMWLGSSQDIHFFGYDTIVGKLNKVVAATTPTTDWDDIDFNNLGAIQLRLALAALSRRSIVFAHLLKTECAAERHFDLAMQALADGAKLHPRSLLLRFNLAVWPMMWSVVAGKTMDPDRAAQPFQALLEAFDSLDYNPLGADPATAEAAYSDEVFPYFEYGQLILKYGVAHGAPQTLAKGSIEDPKEVLRAACHGYMGWAQALWGSSKNALPHLRTALSIYPKMQALLALKLETVLDVRGGVMASLAPPETHAEVVETFIAAAAQYPVLLISHLGRVLPSFSHGGKTDLLGPVMADWWWFANCLEEKTLKSLLPEGDIPAIMRHKRYLPQDIFANRRARKIFQTESTLEKYVFRDRIWLLLHGPISATVSRLKRSRTLRLLYRRLPQKWRAAVRFKLFPEAFRDV